MKHENQFIIGGLAERDTVLDFLKTKKCKFVFRRLRGATTTTWQDREKLRNSGSMLYVVEYNVEEDQPKILEIENAKAFAPLFNPQGNRILFSSTFAPSEISILSLDNLQMTSIGMGAHPHWWIDPQSGENWIVYRTTNMLYTGFPLGRTMKQRVDHNNLPIGEPAELFPYGFGGGISRDGRFLATGYAHLIIADLQLGTFQQPLGNRQLPDGENQACDISVAPDDSQCVMHLRLSECGEGRHDFFGVCNFDGSNYVSFQKPENTEEWQTPEWSTHPDFGTAVATRKDGTYDIYIVRLSDQKYLRLTKDGGYGHVHLWVKPD